MEDREIRYEIRDRAAVLTIDRPKARNALSARAMSQLIDGIARAEADPEARVIVLTGAGDRVFCAGGDLSAMAGADEGEPTQDVRRRYGLLLRRLRDAYRPTLARVNGHALAGGVGLVLACDLAVAVETAELGLPEVEVGLFPMTVMAFLRRHVGPKRALELALTGQRLSAREAVGWGLLNRAVPAAELDAEVASWASKLAAKSAAVLALGRRASAAAEDLPLPEAVEYMGSQLAANFAMEDAAEGVSAFFEKRKPEWKDR